MDWEKDGEKSTALSEWVRQKIGHGLLSVDEGCVFGAVFWL